MAKATSFASFNNLASLGNALSWVTLGTRPTGSASRNSVKPLKDSIEKLACQKSLPTISAVFKDSAILEMIYTPTDRRTRFALWKTGSWSFQDALPIDPLHRLVPYSAENNLIKNEVVLFPSEPEEYGSEEALLGEIQSFIHRYVDVSPFFEKITSYYVLFSWLYDGFNELPYLRVRGDPGCGKTRFLLTVGSLCYKPIFASGASTVSPIFRILDAFKGTLIIDESDFRFSDEKAELVKILNNGNVRGFPVLRSEVSSKGEFNPFAYHVFGPKLVATRGSFDDRALESRFLTEEMGQARLRDDVPINLPVGHKEEALHLRNKLLLFRFRNLNKRAISDSLVDRSIEPRLNQIFVPLLSIVEDEKVRTEFRDVMRQYSRELVNERGLDSEAHVLEVIKSLLAAPETKALSVSEITARFAELYEDEYERKITNKWVGFLIRRRLGLKTERGREGYVIAPTERPKLARLYEKYGLATSGQWADTASAESSAESPEPAPPESLSEVHNVHKFTEP